MINISYIDHIVMTVRDVNATCDFYQNILGMTVRIFKQNRKALHFGNQKINLHQKGQEFEPKASQPTVGAIDLCLVVENTIDEVIAHLSANGVPVEQGPTERTGAHGKMLSIYIRDPDDNLIELSKYIS